MYQSDASDGNITKITYPDGQPMVMHMPTDLVDNRTWLDKGLIALYVEQMRMGQLGAALNKYVTDWAAPLITIHGGHIDGIFYTSKLMDEDMIDDDLRQFTLTNGEPAFQIKRGSKHVIPSLPQKPPVQRTCRFHRAFGAAATSSQSGGSAKKHSSGTRVTDRRKINETPTDRLSHNTLCRMAAHCSQDLPELAKPCLSIWSRTSSWQRTRTHKLWWQH